MDGHHFDRDRHGVWRDPEYLMPLILAPYTLGAQLPASPAGGVTGVGYYLRRRAWWAALAMLVLLVAH